jgi:hypothetical protein
MSADTLRARVGNRCGNSSLVAYRAEPTRALLLPGKLGCVRGGPMWRVSSAQLGRRRGHARRLGLPKRELRYAHCTSIRAVTCTCARVAQTETRRLPMKQQQQRSMRNAGVVATFAAIAIGGCAGYGYYGTTTSAYGGGPRYSEWQNPAFFDARVNERLASIEQHVRADIATGQLPAEAINDFNQRKYQVQQQLAQFGSDGVIDAYERQQIRTNVRAAADIGATPNAYGYQSGFAPRSYYDPSWQWGD